MYNQPAPQMGIFGVPDIGPMLPKAIIGCRVYGSALRRLITFGLPDTGVIAVAFMAGMVDIGVRQWAFMAG
jgi:hypothetical protein